MTHTELALCWICFFFAWGWAQAFYNWRTTRAQLVALRKRARECGLLLVLVLVCAGSHAAEDPLDAAIGRTRAALRAYREACIAKRPPRECSRLYDIYAKRNAEGVALAVALKRYKPFTLMPVQAPAGDGK